MDIKLSGGPEPPFRLPWRESEAGASGLSSDHVIASGEPDCDVAESLWAQPRPRSARRLCRRLLREFLEGRCLRRQITSGDRRAIWAGPRRAHVLMFPSAGASDQEQVGLAF